MDECSFVDLEESELERDFRLNSNRAETAGMRYSGVTSLDGDGEDEFEPLRVDREIAGSRRAVRFGFAEELVMVDMSVESESIRFEVGM